MTQAANLGALGTNVSSTGALTASTLTGALGYANMPTGSVLQVVSANLTSSTTTSSSSFVTTSLTASITPKFSTSKVLILVSGGADNFASNGQATFTVYRNSTNLAPSPSNGFGDIYSGTTRVQGFVSVNHADSPATTSSTAYTLYFASTNGGSVIFNNSNATTAQTATITLMEIAG